MRKGERFLESPWISLSPRIGTVITAPWGERGAPAMGDHRHLPKLTRLLGTSPARQISSVLRQAQPALRPSPASLPWLWRKGLWLLLFRSEWKKKKKTGRWWELLELRVTNKAHKFHKNHGCTWLQLFSCWHPEQTPLLRSWLFLPECFRQPCQRSQVLSTEPQLQKEKTFQSKRHEKRPFSPTPISLAALCSYINKEV